MRAWPEMQREQAEGERQKMQLGTQVERARVIRVRKSISSVSYTHLTLPTIYSV